MRKLWLTYAWKDNEESDVDFVVGRLDRLLVVKFDRRNLIPGQRLWTQIAGFITNPSQCDAWGIVLTPNSITSEPCIEELSYALDRALSARESSFPIFALMNRISAQSLPASLRVRLCISLSDDGWVNKVVAACEGKSPGFVPRDDLSEFILAERVGVDGLLCLEIRPRFKTFSPVVIGVDATEKASGNVKYRSYGPSGYVPHECMLTMTQEGETTLEDGTPVWFWRSNEAAGPVHSYFIHYEKRPQRVFIGTPEKVQWFDAPK
jgi:hypothetical protein